MKSIVRWMIANGRPTEERLANAGLGYLVFRQDDDPIPLLNAVHLLERTAQIEGPDIAIRVVSSTTIIELASIARIALGAKTPREALLRISAGMPAHCTHEAFGLRSHSSGTQLYEQLLLPIENAQRHFAQQYVLALVRALVEMTGVGFSPARIEMTPHPEFGFHHLKAHFDARFSPAANGELRVDFRDVDLDRQFRNFARERKETQKSPPSLVLCVEGSTTESVRHLIRSMLHNGEVPSIGYLAAAASMSPRTFQRCLNGEGNKFSVLLDDERRAYALEILKEPRNRFMDLSANLGFENQATFSRAMRRWTGLTPSQFTKSMKIPQER